MERTIKEVENATLKIGKELKLTSLQICELFDYLVKLTGVDEDESVQ